MSCVKDAMSSNQCTKIIITIALPTNGFDYYNPQDRTIRFVQM